MRQKQTALLAVLSGAPIGCLGGLIGLGGAEFRLPLLVGLFKYSAREAIALNLAVSLVTLLASLVSRLPHAPLQALSSLVPIILSLIAGGVVGAYAGALYANNWSEVRLKRIILVLLISIGLLLIVEAFYPFVSTGLSMPFIVALAVAVVFGVGIGMVSSLLGVAGGELIIPTLVLIFGIDIKIAGTASLIISLPTVAMGIYRHAVNGAFTNRADWAALVFPMGAGSIVGALIGGLLIVYLNGQVIKFILGVILMISAAKIFLDAQNRA